MLAGCLRAAGAPTIALTNTPDRLLAGATRDVVNIAAGPEQAMAAAKSFVNSIVGGLG